MLQVIAGEIIHVPYIGVEPDGTAAAAASVYIRRMDTGEYWDDDAPGGADWVAGPEANDMTAGDADGVFWYEWAADAALGRGTAITIECAATDCISAAHSVTILRDDIADSAEVLTRAVAGDAMALTGAYDAAKSAAQAGDAMALTAGERTSLTAAIWAALTSGLTTVGSVGKRIADYLDAAVSSLIGPGATTVTVTVTDGTDPLEGVPVTIRDQLETTQVAGPIVTNASGEAVFALDDATDYRAIPRTTLFLTGGAQNFTTSGATAVTCTMTRAALPTPTDADCYLLHNQERRVEGDTAFAGATIYVQNLTWVGRQDAAADAIRSPIGTTYTADADGLWSFELAKAAFDAGAVLTLVRTRTMADATTQTETINAVLDADAADDEDRVALADLKLTRT